MKENRPYIEGRGGSECEVIGKLSSICEGNLRRDVHFMRYFFKTLYSYIIANFSVKKSQIFRKIFYFMFSRYCDRLQVGSQKFGSWKEQENYSLYHRVHPASYPMATRSSFPGGKAAVE
jgi:hypothetical protein